MQKGAPFWLAKSIALGIHTKKFNCAEGANIFGALLLTFLLDKHTNAHLKEKSVYLRVIIRPYDLSRNSAIKLCTFKSFAYKVAKPKIGKKTYYILRLNNIILKIYLKIIYLRLKFFKKDFFKDNIIDLFFKICFSSDFNLKQNVYKGHDISWIPILLIAVVMLITAIISAYWDITISRDLGWW